MTLLGPLILVACQAASVSNWNGPERHEFSAKNNGHKVRVVVRHANFAARGRKVTLVKEEDYYTQILLNGKQVRGFDGFDTATVQKYKTPAKLLEAMATEIVQLDVWIDGKVQPVPQRLYDNLMKPDLGPDYNFVWISKDGKAVTIKIIGSDAAGGWVSIWSWRAGRWHRTVVDDC